MSTRKLWTSPFSPTLSTIFLKLELTVNAPFVFLQWRRRLHVIWTRRFPILANEYAWRSTQILQERVRRKCKQRQGTETLRDQVESKRDTSAAGESRRTSKTPLPSTSITRFPQPPSQLLPFSSPSETLASAVPLLYQRQHVRSSTSDARFSTTAPSSTSRTQCAPPPFRPSAPVHRLWRTVSRSHRREQLPAPRHHQYEVRLVHKERREGAAG